jgi:hypothetical protein
VTKPFDWVDRVMTVIYDFAPQVISVPLALLVLALLWLILPAKHWDAFCEEYL